MLLLLLLPGLALAAPRAPFTVVVMPDTQFYACDCSGGTHETFQAQTAWIAEQRAALDVRYVAHLGDCVQNGDAVEAEWTWADAAMSSLEDPVTTGESEGIPYGIAVGNHDQSPFGDPNGTTTFYNQTFGSDRFEARSYYGGHCGDNNDNHYSTFQAGGMDFLVIDLEYDEAADATVLAWALDLLQTHPDHRAIVVGHYLIDGSGAHSAQGAATYAALAGEPNLFLMLGGHYAGEARRSDETEVGTVHTLLADYQSRSNGGDGWLRGMTFVPDEDRIDVWTWSPTLGEFETDDDSMFSLDYAMGLPDGGDSGDSGDSGGGDGGGDGGADSGDGGGDGDGGGGSTDSGDGGGDGGDGGTQGDGGGADPTGADSGGAASDPACGCGGGGASAWLLLLLPPLLMRRRRT